MSTTIKVKSFVLIFFYFLTKSIAGRDYCILQEKYLDGNKCSNNSWIFQYSSNRYVLGFPDVMKKHSENDHGILYIYVFRWPVTYNKESIGQSLLFF